MTSASRRWLNGMLYRSLYAILGRTQVGRALMFIQWSNGFKAGRCGR